MTLSNNPTAKKLLHRILLGDGRISIRFRNINIAIFALAFILMVIAMLWAFGSIVRQISADYAGRYAVSSANALSAHIIKEIGLMSKAARSTAVIEWLADEDNNEKKALAYEEMSGIIGELYSNNLYIGVAGTQNEYKVEEDYAAGSIMPFAVLDDNNPDDAWYFVSLATDMDYLLSVGIDHVLKRKRVWLDYNVVQNGVTLGVISTGLEFSHVAGELFSQYGSNNIRGLIIDGNGVIYIDSSLLDNEDFMHHDFETKIEKEFSDPVFLSHVKSYLNSIYDSFMVRREPSGIALSSDPYHYMTIAPIKNTNWSLVLLYDSSSLLSMSLFMPIFLVVPILLIAFALATNTISYRLIFMPLEKLVSSLAHLKDNNKEQIYGVERNDEFGNLSNTIQDLFTKANYDALTGIYNRRFMENNLDRIMMFLSRSNSLLSVLMVDVDFFKKYNDTYGHEKGDICLKAVAQALAGSITRTNDFAARYGGEEFVGILPNTDEAGARVIAESLIENVRKLNIPHVKNAAAPCVTISVGVATGKVGYTQSWTDYLKRADEALYMSKQNGRNQYTYLDFEEHTGL